MHFEVEPRVLTVVRRYRANVTANGKDMDNFLEKFFLKWG